MGAPSTTIAKRGEMPVTILELAKYRGAKSDEHGVSGAEFARLRLPMMGGCEGCHATIAAYNAYPSSSGYLRCADCIGDDGYLTVEAASWAIFGDAVFSCNPDESAGLSDA